MIRRVEAQTKPSVASDFTNDRFQDDFSRAHVYALLVADVPREGQR